MQQRQEIRSFQLLFISIPAHWSLPSALFSGLKCLWIIETNCLTCRAFSSSHTILSSNGALPREKVVLDLPFTQYLLGQTVNFIPESSTVSCTLLEMPWCWDSLQFSTEVSIHHNVKLRVGCSRPDNINWWDVPEEVKWTAVKFTTWSSLHSDFKVQFSSLIKTLTLYQLARNPRRRPLGNNTVYWKLNMEVFSQLLLLLTTSPRWSR